MTPPVNNSRKRGMPGDFDDTASPAKKLTPQETIATAEAASKLLQTGVKGGGYFSAGAFGTGVTLAGLALGSTSLIVSGPIGASLGFAFVNKLNSVLQTKHNDFFAPKLFLSKPLADQLDQYDQQDPQLQAAVKEEILEQFQNFTLEQKIQAHIPQDLESDLYELIKKDVLKLSLTEQLAIYARLPAQAQYNVQNEIARTYLLTADIVVKLTQYATLHSDIQDLIKNELLNQYQSQPVNTQFEQFSSAPQFIQTATRSTIIGHCISTTELAINDLPQAMRESITSGRDFLTKDFATQILTFKALSKEVQDNSILPFVNSLFNEEKRGNAKKYYRMATLRLHPDKIKDLPSDAKAKLTADFQKLSGLAGSGGLIGDILTGSKTSLSDSEINEIKEELLK